MREIQNAAVGRVGPFPEVGSVLSGWQNAMTFIKITTVVTDYEAVKTETAYSFQGVFEYMSPRELFFKSEGQRAWKWCTLWTKNGEDIQVGDIIEDPKGTRYKVTRSNDWGQAGYSQYEILQDYIDKAV